MGQKAHPYGLRLGYIKPWKSRWFAGKNYIAFLHEDLKLRKILKEKFGAAGISNIEIERSGGRVRVRIFTARPGVIIGRRGQEIDKIKDELGGVIGGELFVDIKEIKNPHIDAQLVADNITMQLVKRIGFRRAMKKAVQLAMQKGALGIRILCKGRLGGSEIARQEGYREGKVPLNTFRADVDYGFSEALTTYGKIGCKVWIYKGDILVKKEEAHQKLIRDRKIASDEVEKADTAASKAEEQASGKEEHAEAVVSVASTESKSTQEGKAETKKKPSKDTKES